MHTITQLRVFEVSWGCFCASMATCRRSFPLLSFPTWDDVAGKCNPQPSQRAETNSTVAASYADAGLTARYLRRGIASFTTGIHESRVIHHNHMASR